MDLESILQTHDKLIWYVIQKFISHHKIPYHYKNDLYQEACLLLFKKIGKYDPKIGSLETFIYSFVNIACLEYKKNQIENHYAIADRDEVRSTNILQHEEQLAVIMEYSKDYFTQTVLNMKYQGYTQEEIAETLGVNQSTVSRALSHFKKYLLEQIKS